MTKSTIHKVQWVESRKAFLVTWKRVDSFVDRIMCLLVFAVFLSAEIVLLWLLIHLWQYSYGRLLVALLFFALWIFIFFFLRCIQVAMLDVVVFDKTKKNVRYKFYPFIWITYDSWPAFIELKEWVSGGYSASAELHMTGKAPNICLYAVGGFTSWTEAKNYCLIATQEIRNEFDGVRIYCRGAVVEQ